MNFVPQVQLKDNDFEINGKYYKFSEEKWKNYFMNAGDSRHLDDKHQENFSKDGNLTLNEGREGRNETKLNHSFRNEKILLNRLSVTITVKSGTKN